MSAGQPSRPANILNIVAINQGRQPLTMEEPVAARLDVDAVMTLTTDGAVVVDTRSSAAFGKGHIPGAYNAQLTSPEFEQRIGWITDTDAPLLLVLDADEAVPAALHKMAFIGLDRRVAGYLSGGLGAWIEAGQAVVVLPQIGVDELHGELQNGNGMATLDVRESSEWSDGHIEGAHSMSYKQLAARLGELDVATDQRLAVICAADGRSSTACSILLRQGYENLHNVIGGMNAWRASGLPMVDDQGGAVCAT